MSATPSRIAFIKTQFRKSIAEDAAVKTRHGTLARKSDDPIETFFDNEDDAQIMADARQALLGGERRRFVATLAGVEDVQTIDYVTAIPMVTYVDPARMADLTALIADITIDYAAQRSALQVWG